MLFAIDSGWLDPGVVRFVDASKTDGDQTGLGWDSAYQYLQDALDEAGSTDITGIAVANGTYYPDEDKDSGQANYDQTGYRQRGGTGQVCDSRRFDVA